MEDPMPVLIHLFVPLAWSLSRSFLASLEFQSEPCRLTHSSYGNREGHRTDIGDDQPDYTWPEPWIHCYSFSHLFVLFSLTPKISVASWRQASEHRHPISFQLGHTESLLFLVPPLQSSFWLDRLLARDHVWSAVSPSVRPWTSDPVIIASFIFKKNSDKKVTFWF